MNHEFEIQLIPLEQLDLVILCSKDGFSSVFAMFVGLSFRVSVCCAHPEGGSLDLLIPNSPPPRTSLAKVGLNGVGLFHYPNLPSPR